MSWWTNRSLLFKVFAPQTLVLVVCAVIIITARQGFDDIMYRAERIIENDVDRTIKVMEGMGEVNYVALSIRAVIVMTDKGEITTQQNVWG